RLAHTKMTLEKQNQNQQQAWQTLAQLQAELASLRQEIPPELSDLDTLRSAIGRVQNQIEILQKAEHTAREQWVQAQKQFASVQAAYQAAIEAHRESQRQQEETTSAWQQGLLHSGFSDESAYLAARLTDEAIVNIERQIAQYE
ncbi:SMC family ATPase, partial|nr:SMC family ATPase [Escherichia coli]